VRIASNKAMDRSAPQSCSRQAAAQPPPGSITIRGRAFTPQELQQIKAIVDASPKDHRFKLSQEVCRALGWQQPNGRLKDRACRDVLGRLHDMGLLRLPPPRRPPVSRRPVPITDRTKPRPVLRLRPRDIGQTSFALVTGSGDAKQHKLWNEYVERYHYLGYGVPLGPHLKYFVTVGREPIACLAFGGAAWRVEARDQWIGWSSEQRQRSLCYVVSNTRFVMLPWIEAPNLASRILALAARRVPTDWLRRYAYRPLLLETFVHAERHAGTCYRAANWIVVGRTKGRGKLDRHFKANQPVKTVLLYPLAKDASALLRTR
jgi:Domain of unknown function (DUF4338)